MDLVPYCGESYDLIENMCYERTNFTKTCEKGQYNDKYNMCVQTEITGPIVTCPDEYELVKGSKHDGLKEKHSAYCEKRFSRAGPSVCPWGTKPEGKRCASYQNVTPFWNCPAGTQPRGQFCATKERYNCSNPIVPISKKKKRRLAEKDEKLNIIRYGIDGLMEQPELIAVQRMCEREKLFPAVMQCPQGAAQMKNKCVIATYYEPEETKGSIDFDTAPARPVCPANFEFCDTKKQGGKCCKNIEFKPFRSCNHGFVEEDGHCVRQFEPVWVCPVEKKLRKGNACEGYDWQPAEMMVTMIVEERKKKFPVVRDSGKMMH